jgi:hypothetical protein
MYPTDDFYFDVPMQDTTTVDTPDYTSDDVNYDAGTSPDSAPIE